MEQSVTGAGTRLRELASELDRVAVALDALERGTSVATVEEAAAEAIALHKGAGSIKGAAAEVAEALQDRAKAVLSDIIAETGETSWRTEYGTAYVPAPSVRVYYDASGLDVACESDPALAALLRPFRREVGVAGSLTVR